MIPALRSPTEGSIMKWGKVVPAAAVATVALAGCGGVAATSSTQGSPQGVGTGTPAAVTKTVTSSSSSTYKAPSRGSTPACRALKADWDRTRSAVSAGDFATAGGGFVSIGNDFAKMSDDPAAKMSADVGGVLSYVAGGQTLTPSQQAELTRAVKALNKSGTFICGGL